MTTLDVPHLTDYRDQIARALRYAGGTHTVEDVEAMVERNEAQWWPVGPASVVVTEIVQHPRRRVLHFFLAAGRMADIERAAPMILAWGRVQGCTAATLVGRKGWLRSFLARTGWRDTGYVTMTTEL